MADSAGRMTREVHHRMPYGRAMAALLASCILVQPALARARSLEAALVSTFPGILSGSLPAQGQQLALLFSRTVAGSFPVTGASAAYVYRFDPATDTFQRLPIPLGPVFSERAESIGKGRISIGLNYLYASFNEVDGHDLNALVSHSPTSGKNFIQLCSLLSCEPVAGAASLDLEAQIVALSATYGVTPDIDVNVFVPVVRTYLEASTLFIGPDPRASPDPRFLRFVLSEHATETNVGVGDLLLRARYVFWRGALANLAGGLVLSLPTGSTENFQGTGDVQLTPALYASRPFADRVEPHVNLGFQFDANDFDRSQGRYSLGADVRVFDWLTLNNDFLGRSDIDAPVTVSRPVFLQAERSDVFQYSTGLKLAPFHRTVVFFFNALLPLNSDGVRANEVLTGGVEAVF